MSVDFGLVEDRVSDAKAIAFDTCHKIYLLMDDEQVEKMREYGYDPLITSAEADPYTMFEMLKDWYYGSCNLRFIEAVSTHPTDPNLGFETLIGQGENWDEEEDYEEED
jgi:hypothetical protein